LHVNKAVCFEYSIRLAVTLNKTQNSKINTMKKREFISKVVLASGAVLTLPFLTVSCDDEGDEVVPASQGGNTNNNNGGGNSESGLFTADLSDPQYSALLQEGGYIAARNIIVVNVGNNNYIALSSVCTHQGCQVSYSRVNNNLPCGCHGSVFSTTGSVINGPAEAPLQRYSVTVENNILTVT
jgi:cytochrome b6-f complex iron-sulfur subunit